MTASRGIAVVTGGSAGVGRATVQRLADVGFDVAVLARGEAGLAGAVTDVRERGGQGLAVPTDVADSAAVDAATDRVEAELGPIDVWVNCAFAGSLAFFWDTELDEFRRITEVTYFGQVHGTHSALRVMRPRDRGTIVNVSSAMAYRSIPLQSAYCGAKHAVKGFTESVLTELRHSGSNVRVALVTLPGVNTVQFDWNLNKMPGHPMPVPPIFQPETCARAIVHAAQHPRRNSWVGISTAYTVLGNRLAPALLDRYLARTGVNSQQTDQSAPRHGSNLFRPCDDIQDRGAHGPFDSQAHHRDPVSFLGRHRTAAMAASGAIAAGCAAAAAVRRS